MCIDLLKKIATPQLPYTTSDPAVSDRLRVLKAAGLIKAMIPAAHQDGGDSLSQEVATVLEITHLGRKTLRAGAIEEVAFLPSARQRRTLPDSHED